MRATDRGPRTAEAMEWLVAVLQHGPQHTVDILEAATEDGISHGTLRLAKTALGVVARKDFGVDGAWTWQLPADADEARVSTMTAKAITALQDVAAAAEECRCEMAGDDDQEDIYGSDDDRLLRARDVARIFGVSRSRAYELMSNGTLPVIRIGVSVRVSKRSLERWIREQEGA